MFSELAQMMHNMLLDSPVSPREVAQAVSKPYSTLLREVNIYDSGAKLGVETMFKIIQHTGNIKPLEYMAEQLGYTLVPLEGAEKKKAMPPLDISGISTEASGVELREPVPGSDDPYSGSGPVAQL